MCVIGIMQVSVVCHWQDSGECCVCVLLVGLR